ncbi:class I adenylate-forming enzyme family protein [Lutimaribacter marinistellae]|uniref:Class I adenylate-forming enzyme family protein n=1 Tax=Lutimaribacter marinistellae TaxID=1820329 RepID=A0ABV7TLR7_9RHOB
MAMSAQDAVAHVLATNPVFATGTECIRGVEYPVFTNIPQDLRNLLSASREAQGDGAADFLVHGVRRWTYDEFCRDVDGVARALYHEHGVRDGKRVALAMRNCPEMLILMMAISSLGAVVVFLNAWWMRDELDFALEDTGARIVFADTARMDRLRQSEHSLVLYDVETQDPENSFQNSFLRHEAPSVPTYRIDPDSDFAIMYSSGTTSLPKGVVLTHRGAMNAVYTWLLQAVIAPMVTPPDPSDAPSVRPVTLITTPLFHVTATHPSFLLSIAAGAKVVLMEKWDAEAAIRLIEQEEVTRFVGVPTQSADLRIAAQSAGKKLKTLTQMVSGGAKRPAAQVAELHETFPAAEAATGWGMTETNALGIGLSGPEYRENPDVAGRLYPPLQEVRFVDDQGRDVAPGEVGEMTVKSVTNMRCYINQPEATAETMQDGWLRTGDLAKIDAEGLITIVDRKKNIIIRGGENIACLDVEGSLHHHSDVLEACVFPIPHPRLGETVGAAIQAPPGTQLTCDTIAEFLSGRIAKFKIPERIWVQAEPLPRGATDKIDRRAIRASSIADMEKTT